MAITYNLKNDIRYNQGLQEGMEKGIEKGAIERNTAVVLSLLAHTDHPVEEIAKLVNAPVNFVNKLK